MREEIRDWLKQAEADLRKAKILFREKEFDGVAFNSHQSVEKSLKTVYMIHNKKGKPGHSVIYLAEELNVPKNLLVGIKNLGPEYLISRYPDIAGVAPVDLYTEDKVADYLKTAEEVLEWATKQIKK